MGWYVCHCAESVAWRPIRRWPHHLCSKSKTAQTDYVLVHHHSALDELVFLGRLVIVGCCFALYRQPPPGFTAPSASQWQTTYPGGIRPSHASPDPYSCAFHWS